MEHGTIDILLSTYNGSRYIHDFYKSIVVQRRAGMNLVVRDDGSSDGTVDFLRQAVAEYSDASLLDTGDNVGVTMSFSRLLGLSRADYCFFADQDDVWHKDKVDLFMAAMVRLEDMHGKDVPLMVFSDLRVVDENLEELCDSLWRFQGLNPSEDASFNRLLLQPMVTGCAVMFNRKARDLAYPIPSEALMHDWWLSLVVSGLGYFSLINEPTVDYRQHSANEVGARDKPSAGKITQLFSLEYINRFRADIHRCIRQARVYGERFADRLSPRDRQALSCLTALEDINWFERRRCLLRNRVMRSGLLRNMVMFLLV
ncbi:MAG: hypothetical protein Kow0096_13110 [Thiohalomonadaceae bacterium]